MDNPDNLKHWQPGLVSFEHQEGEFGKVGAKSKAIYDMGKRRIEMVETIVRRDLPDHFDAIYVAKGVWNKVENQFIELSENKTKWVKNNELKFKGLLMSVIGFLMPASFKKESFKYLENFKKFAEAEG